MTQWYVAAFRKEYLDLYYRRDEESAKREAAFARKALGLPEGALVLDLACGAGRHARALAALGMRVVGADLSRDLLAEAEGVTRVRADMRALPFAGAFHAITSFFTSFGYFDEDGNRATLASVAAALRPGGVFFLDFLNAVAVRAHLRAESVEERDGKRFLIRRRIEDDRVLKEVSVQNNGDSHSYTESVRLYHHQDLVRRLLDSGLDPIAAYGDYDGGDFTTDSERCILVARRP